MFLNYTPGRVSELYTNQILPYYRAPHIFLGFPTRYLDRGIILPRIILIRDQLIDIYKLVIHLGFLLV